jgi:hypothetical protein
MEPGYYSSLLSDENNDFLLEDINNCTEQQPSPHCINTFIPIRPLNQLGPELNITSMGIYSGECKQVLWLHI